MYSLSLQNAFGARSVSREEVIDSKNTSRYVDTSECVIVYIFNKLLAFRMWKVRKTFVRMRKSAIIFQTRMH